MSQERELTVKKLYLEQKNSCLEDGKEVVIFDQGDFVL